MPPEKKRIPTENLIYKDLHFSGLTCQVVILRLLFSVVLGLLMCLEEHR